MLVAENGSMLLRFVDGRPGRSITTAFLEWLCEQIAVSGKHVLVLSLSITRAFHVSKQVKTWLREHHQTVQQQARTGQAGVRIIPCWLPTKSPWLNRVEPKWIPGSRAIVEPARLLTAEVLKQRVCDYFGCELVGPLTDTCSSHRRAQPYQT
jgi:hypothetical protein